MADDTGKVGERATPPDSKPANAAVVSPTPQPAPTPPVVAAPPTEGLRPIYFDKVDLNPVDDPVRIDFTRATGSDAPPPEMRAVRRQIEEVARLVRVLFRNDKPRRVDFFSQLHITAACLAGPAWSLEVAADNLQDVKDSIADAFPALRGSVWRANSIILLATALASAIAVAVAYRAGALADHAVATGLVLPRSGILAALLIPFGVAIGLYVEFVLRVNDDIPYEQLMAINPGRWSPLTRAVNTLVVAYVFAWLLWDKVFQVGVGGILLNDYVGKDPALSIAVGFVTGFAFPYVRDIVQRVRPTVR